MGINLLFDLHRCHDVGIHRNTAALALEGDGRAELAQFYQGRSLNISAVVIGGGIAPATEFTAQTGLMIDNGIVGINAGRDIRFIKRLLESRRPIDVHGLAKPGCSLQEGWGCDDA